MTDILHFSEDCFVRTGVSDQLEVFEDSLDHIQVVFETFLTQSDLHLEVAIAVKHVIWSTVDFEGQTLLLQVAQQRVLAFVTSKVAEITQWSRFMLLLTVGQRPL